MKFSFKSFIASLAILCVLSTSFAKTPSQVSSIDEPVLLKKLLSKVLGNTNEYTFTYDNNKLSKIEYSLFDGTTRKGYYKLVYNGTVIEKIQEFNTSNTLISTTTFTYANDKVAEVIKTESSSNKAEKISFTYTTTNSVVVERRIGTAAQQNQLADKEILYFNDKKLVKRVENGIVTNATIYEYDKAFNPMQNVLGMVSLNAYMNTSFGMFSSSGLEGIENNRKKQTVYTDKDVLDYVLVFKTSYTDKNYPLNKMSPPDSPGAFEYSYSYY